MTITAKLFMSGRSQALRLPAKLRLQAQEVRIEQIGTGLWLQPETSASSNMGQWLQDFYANSEVLPPAFLSDRQDPAPQDRDWS
jgi:antitoxin VapB